jgi:hypothetical protein
MIAAASITIGQFALLNGRALAHAAVTFQGGSSVDPSAIYGHPNVSLNSAKLRHFSCDIGIIWDC